MKTSVKDGHHGLATKFERMLTELANIPSYPPVGTAIGPQTHFVAAIKRFGERHLAKLTESDVFAMRDLLRKAWASADSREREWYLFLLRQFYSEARRRLQWFESDDGKNALADWETKREHLNRILVNPGKVAGSQYSAAELLFHFIDGQDVNRINKISPPEFDHFEAAAFHLQRNLHRARYCEGPECQAPYFLAAKKGQRYCSSDCATPARRASKRRWWNENRAK